MMHLFIIGELLSVDMHITAWICILLIMKEINCSVAIHYFILHYLLAAKL